jgi:hypothetical protein
MSQKLGQEVSVMVALPMAVSRVPRRRVLVAPLQQQSMLIARARGETGHFSFCRLLSCVDVPTAPACEYHQRL